MNRDVLRRVIAGLSAAVLVLTGASGLTRASPAAPTARASATPSSAAPDEDIQFSGADSTPGSLANTLIYTWYFGDMESDSGATVSHSFEFDGVYDVTLIVQESNGLMALDTVRVTITSPIYGSAGVTGAVIHTQPPAPVSVDEDALIEFDCLSSWPSGTDPAILTCAWDFGDGATAGMPKPYAKGRAFELVGTYDEMMRHPGHHFEMENRIPFSSGDVEFDLMDIDPTTGKFKGIEFKNAAIGQRDIEQLLKYIDYMNDPDVINEGLFDSWRVVMNSDAIDPLNPTAALQQYLALAESNGIPVDFV